MNQTISYSSLIPLPSSLIIAMRFEDYADLYQLEENLWWFVGMREITAVLLDDVISRIPSPLILDAGCGTGGNLEWLRRYTDENKIYGIDVVDTALGFCHKKDLKNLTQASATDLPFADEAFDVVTSFDVLVQIPGEGNDERAMREMFRVLKPDGIAFVRCAAYEWMRSGHDKALNTQRRYTLKELKEKLERAGFETIRATYANTFAFPLAAMRRLVLKRIGLVDEGSDVKPLSSKTLNSLLTNGLRLEAKWLRRKQAKLPAGLSAICVARKRGMRDE
jgi:SAM-dependent methyltransferase